LFRLGKDLWGDLKNLGGKEHVILHNIKGQGFEKRSWGESVPESGGGEEPKKKREFHTGWGQKYWSVS